jgi:LysR family transcriptional regulator, chromosome initiation inhibitor
VKLNLDYGQLAALVAVVREGRFEAAARALHLTPSALSQRIKALEERVGGVLLTRAQPCTITPLGQPLLRHAQQVALLEQGLLGEWQPGQPRQRGGAPTASPRSAPALLPVAVNADSLSTWFVAAAAQWASATGALLDVRVDDEGHTQEALRRGEVLAAVSARATPVQGCRSQRLGAMRYLATASPAYVQQHLAGGLTRAALAWAPVLVFNAKDALQQRWLRRFTRSDLAPPAHRLPSSTAFVQACEAGLGWALNPAPLVKEAIAAGRLVVLGGDRGHLDVPLYWQCTRLRLPLLEVLTAEVHAAARGVLRSVA